MVRSGRLGKLRSRCLRIAALLGLCALGGLAAAAAPSGAATAQAADSPQSRVHSVGGRVEFETSLRMPEPPERVWAVLLDYDSLSRYQPGVDTSRVLRREGPVTIVRQAGSARYLVRRRFSFDLAFRRSGTDSLLFREIRGEPRGFSGVWVLKPDGEGTLVDYSGSVESLHGVPGFLMRKIVRRETDVVLPAMAAEVRRRDAEGPPR